MRFPSRDLTDQYISSSYQDVLQQYMLSNYLYVLDGYGNVVFSIPSSSVGYTLITSDVTSSMTVASASVSTVINILQTTQSVSSSWASSSISSLIANYANYAEYSGTASLAESASISNTASYLLGSGAILGGIQFDTASAVSAQREGYVFWDNENHTLAIKPDITSSTLQVGQETWIRYVAGEDIANGDAIYVSSIPDTDGHPICFRAIADGTRTKYAVVAVATNDAASGSHNIATIVGVVNDLNMASYPAGSPIFLSTTTPGGYRIGPPPEPYERVLIGYSIRQDATQGRLYVGIVGIPDAFKAFVGMISVPTISTSSMTPTGSIVTIGSAACTLCTTADGLGTLRTYTIPQASFPLTASFLDAQYILATYNSGSPIYIMSTDRSSVDSVQTTTVYTLLMGAGGKVSYTGWDAPGTLLANKDMLRVQALRGIEREDGLMLSYSGSRFVTITGGHAWQGIQRLSLPPVTSSVDRLVLIAHSASVWSGSTITQYNNTQYDNGINLVPLDNNKYVTNWVYRAIGNLNTTLIQLSTQYDKPADALAANAPSPPPELHDVAFLVGRAVFQKGVNVPYEIDSAFTEIFGGGITVHNNLIGLQGGAPNEYYHLTATEYTQLQSGTASYSVSSSLAQTASYVDASALSNFLLPMQFSYKSSTAAGDPGNGNFRYNSLLTSSITNIYISNATSNGLDVSRIFNALTSGSYDLYIQDKQDYTRASLFAVNGTPTDNTGWYTIPVLQITSSINGLPVNNRDCLFLVFNRGSSLITGGTYQITASQAVTSSYAFTASHALNGGGGGTTLQTGSYYPITSSYADTASYFSGSISNAIFAQTASLALRVSGSGIDIPPYDYSYVVYTGPLNQVSTASYYIGGGLPPTGSLVARLTCIYSGNLFIGVSKSLS